MSSRIPSPLIRLLKNSLFENERVIWQGRPDAWTDMMMMIRVFWWIGPPWLAITVFGIQQGWIDENAMFFLWTGVLMLVGPIALYITDLQTLFVITDRRALILRNEWGKKSAKATMHENMSKLEVLPVRGDVGHLNFASGVSTKSPDADYTGRYGFRHVKDAAKVRALLDEARRS